ncbi:MAG: efflux RND transporter periplasmic adaptor subunit [Flavobacteriales bacterium]
MNKFLPLTFVASLLVACSDAPPDAHDHEHAAQPSASDTTHHHDENITLNAEQLRTLGIRIEALETRSMTGNLRLTGRILSSPVSKARITSPIGAKVVDVLVDEGAHVRKGQPLIALNDLAFFRMQEEYLMARADQAVSAAERDRQRTLSEGNANARKTLQQAEAKAVSDEVRMRSLAGQLRLLGVDPDHLQADQLQQRFVLRSPVDGRVNGISVHLDERVETTTVVAEVIDLHHFHVHLNAYERDLARLKEGVSFDFDVINLPGERFKGEVFSIGRTFDSDGRSIPVHAHVTQGSEKLVEGMSVSASIPTTAATSLSVPTSAIASTGDDAFIYLVAGNTSDGGQRYEEVQVVTGTSSGGFTAITPVQMLPTNAQVVVNGVFNLRNMRTISEGHEH